MAGMKDFSKPSEQFMRLEPSELMPLPAPFVPPCGPLRGVNPDRRGVLETTLDGYSAIALPKPKSPEDEQALVAKFLDGLRKLLSQDSNWTFWQPLQLSLDNCTRCQSCSDACHIYEASGGQDAYRPSYRGEMRR